MCQLQKISRFRFCLQNIIIFGFIVFIFSLQNSQASHQNNNRLFDSKQIPDFHRYQKFSSQKQEQYQLMYLTFAWFHKEKKFLQILANKQYPLAFRQIFYLMLRTSKDHPYRIQLKLNNLSADRLLPPKTQELLAAWAKDRISDRNQKTKKESKKETKKYPIKKTSALPITKIARMSIAWQYSFMLYYLSQKPSMIHVQKFNKLWQSILSHQVWQTQWSDKVGDNGAQIHKKILLGHLLNALYFLKQKQPDWHNHIYTWQKYFLKKLPQYYSASDLNTIIHFPASHAAYIASQPTQQKPSSTSKDQQEIIRQLKKWQSSIQGTNLPFYRGKIIFPEHTHISILYNFSATKQQAVFFWRDQPLLISKDGVIYWQEQGRFYQISSAMENDTKSHSVYFNIQLDFFQTQTNPMLINSDFQEESSSLNINFSLDTSLHYSFQWHKLWQTLLAKTDLVEKKTSGNNHSFLFFNYNMANPFASTKVQIKIKNDLPQKITIGSATGNDHLVLDQLVFGKNQGTIFPEKYLSEAKKNQAIHVLEHPLPSAQLKFLFLKKIFALQSQEDKNNKDSTEQNISPLLARIQKEMQHDFFYIKKYNMEQLRSLSRKYESYAKHNLEVPDFYGVAALFANHGYEFSRAQKLYETYFHLLKEQDHDQQMRLRLSSLDDSVSHYWNTLVQNGHYAKAQKMLTQSLSQNNDNIKIIDNQNQNDKQNSQNSQNSLEHFLESTYLDNTLHLLDILTRQKKWAKTMRLAQKATNNVLRALSAKKALHPQDNSGLEINQDLLDIDHAFKIHQIFLSQLYILAYKHNYQAINQTQKQYQIFTKFISKRQKQRLAHIRRPISNFFSIQWQRETQPVRLKFGNMLPGQGKNFCVPVSLQFVLQSFGDNKTSQIEIARAMDTNEKGTNIVRSFDYMAKRSFRAVAIPGNEQTAASFLQAGIPLLILLSPPGQEIGHLATIIGLDKKNRIYYLYEPSRKMAIDILHQKQIRPMQNVAGNIFIAFVPPNLSTAQQRVLQQWEKQYASQNQLAMEILQFIDMYSKGNQSYTNLNKQMRLLQSIQEKDKDKRFAAFFTYHSMRILLQKWQQKLIQEQNINETIAYTKRMLHYYKDNPPKFSRSLRILGQLALFLEDTSLAKSFLFKAIEKDPRDIASHQLLGTLFFNEKKWPMAHRFMLNAYQNAGHYSVAPQQIKNKLLFALATIAYHRGQNNEMIQYLLLTIDIRKPNSKLYQFMVRQLKRIGSQQTLQFLSLTNAMQK